MNSMDQPTDPAVAARSFDGSLATATSQEARTAPRTDMDREPRGTRAWTGDGGPSVAPSDDRTRLQTGAPPAPVESLAAIDGHPIHPMLVPLPIGSFVGAFVADLAYAQTHDRFWARGARYLTQAGIVTGLLAGSTGALDFVGRERIRSHREAWIHAGGNLLVIGLALVSLSLRQRDEKGASAGPGLALSATIAGLLTVTGWLGGELPYRYRIGVVPGPRERTSDLARAS